MGWGGYGYYSFKPYVPVAVRQERARKKIAKLMKKRGALPQPVAPSSTGRKIATTFWGGAWCANLESYSDFANRLPRGRSYLRNGSVMHLEVSPARVEALVAGSELYEVGVEIRPLPAPRWKHIVRRCLGRIDSLVGLLRGRLDRGVMEALCRQGEGLFPAPREMSFSCTCPDWASMCKHVAATLYGVGARLDERPDLLFRLRKVDEKELLAAAGKGATAAPAAAGGRVLEGEDLGQMFGIEMDKAAVAASAAAAPPRGGKRRPRLRVVQGGADRPARAAAVLPGTEVSARDLIGRGIPRTTFQNWVTAGHLLPTGTRGVYRVTGAAAARIEAFPARR